MFEFTEDDLKANKRGRLSQSQKDWLKSIARGTRSSSWTGLFVSLGFVSSSGCLCKTNARAPRCFQTP